MQTTSKNIFSKYKKLFRIIFIIMLVFAYHHQYLWRTFPATIKDILTAQYNLSIKKFSILIACMYYPYLIIQLLSGYFIQRCPILLIIFFSIGLHIIGCWFFLSAHTYHSLLFGYALVGATGGIFTILALHTARQLLSPKNYPAACGIIFAIGLSGGIIGGTPYRWLTTISDWRTILYFYSYFCILSIIVCTSLYRLPMIKSKFIQQKQIKQPFRMSQFLCRRPLWYCSLYITFQYATMSFFVSTWLIPFAIADLHSHQLWIYGLNIWALTSYMAGSIFFGNLARTRSKKNILIGLSILGIIASMVLIYGSKDNSIIFAVCLVCIGISLSALPVLLALFNDTTPENEVSTGNSIVVVMANVGGVCLIYLAGDFIHKTLPQNELLQYKHVFFVIPLSFLIASIIALFLPNSNYLSLQNKNQVN